MMITVCSFKWIHSPKQPQVSSGSPLIRACPTTTRKTPNKTKAPLKLQEVHKKLFGEPAKLIAMHAGLECGVIGEKYPGMQMASFGPTIESPHSPNERVQIASVEKFWNYLKLVLENL